MTVVATRAASPQVGKPRRASDDWDSLLERQRQLEENGMAEGADRFRKNLQRAEVAGASSTTGAARLLIKSALVNLENAIRSTIEHSAGGRGKGRALSGIKWWTLVGPDVAAYMTLRVVVDATATGLPVSIHKVATSITGLILDELRYRRFKEQAPELFRYKMESFQTPFVNKAKSLKASIAFAQIDTRDLDLSNPTQLRLGMQLIDLLCSTSDWFQCGHLNDPTKRYGKKTVLVMNKETRDRLCARNDVLAFLSPLVGPMVVTPLPWTPTQRGGFRFALRSKFSLVRRNSKTHERQLAAADMPVVYEAVNRIQNTAWKVNTTVLGLVEEIRDLGGGYAGIPCSKNEPSPEHPADRAEEQAVKTRNYMRRVKAAEVDRLIAEAQSLAEEARIYFPHSLDFRGRIYPLASRLNPQGDDLSRALLTFAEGKPLDDEGAHWLAIHGANMMGATPEGQKVSKMTLDQRVEWVEDNRERIFEVADEPFNTAWWIRADKPLQFYAFAVEWTAYCRATEQGDKYWSSLPVHMDGTANGLQHFAALLRDATTAKAVNVIPDDKPQDIYQLVADSIVDRLTGLAPTEPLAALWLALHEKTGLVDRRFAKQPTMTWAYGSRTFGFAKQIEGYLREREDFRELRTHFAQGERSLFRPACTYMAGIIWDSLKTTAVAAFDAMAWMQKVAWGITKQNKSLSWTVPETGFPVYQGYFQNRKSTVSTTLAGRIIKPLCYQPTDKVNRQKEANSISPNVVHSLDAAALMLTVVQGAKEGMSSFSMIHDSFGTLAQDCPALSRILRESFIRLYSEHDVLGSLYDQLSRQWADPAACPLPPTLGTLDLEAVREAQFFFC